MPQKNSSSATPHFPTTNLIKNSNIINYRCSLEKDYPIIEISKNAEQILGYQAAAFYKNPSLWIERIHPENRPQVKKFYLETTDQQKQTLVYRFKHAAGRYVWLQDERITILNKEGNPTAISGTAIDISRQNEAELNLKELNENLEKRIEENTRNLKAANHKLKKKLQQCNEAEKKISKQQKRLRLLQAGINYINDMVVISKAPVDDPLNSSIVLVNKAFEEFTGYIQDEVIGKSPSFLLGEKTGRAKVQKFNNVIRKNEQARVEFINYKKDGSTYWVDLEMSPFPAEEEDMLYWVGINRDISEQIQHRNALKKSLREKDTLLAEVHHRVKNNLAVISGLLEMQSFNADNEEIANALQESQSRIQSIATVHEILYQSDSFANIMLNIYIDELTSYIANTFNHDGANIRFEKDVDSISLTVKQAVPCGLLLNELITNAYKHAFQGLDEGTIFISMHRENDTVRLEVRDDGVGLPADLNAEKPSSLGMKLIKTLVRQLEGSFMIEKKPATAFRIVFEAED